VPVVQTHSGIFEKLLLSREDKPAKNQVEKQKKSSIFAFFLKDYAENSNG
jgi:hypothetical protein